MVRFWVAQMTHHFFYILGADDVVRPIKNFKKIKGNTWAFALLGQVLGVACLAQQYLT
jgi:hypothetical protein